MLWSWKSEIAWEAAEIFPAPVITTKPSPDSRLEHGLVGYVTDETEVQVRVRRVGSVYNLAGRKSNFKLVNSIARHSDLVCDPRISSAEGEAAYTDTSDAPSRNGHVKWLELRVGILGFLASPDSSKPCLRIVGCCIEATGRDLHSRSRTPSWVRSMSTGFDGIRSVRGTHDFQLLSQVSLVVKSHENEANTQ